MRLLTKPELSMPADCGVCHATENREWFLDTGVYLDFIGVFYICNMCMVDLTHMAGGLTQEEVFDAAQIQLEELHFKDLELEEVSRLSHNVTALLPLTFETILEIIAPNLPERANDDRSGIDPVPSEPEPDSHVADDPLDGINEPDDSGDDGFKLIKHEPPTFTSWE